MNDRAPEVAISPTDIAIIGIAVRLPGAGDPEEFWKQICRGRELLTALDEDELRASGTSDAMLADPRFVRVSGLIDNAGAFDADFFRIAQGEARLMDPQHRLFLELCWSALEDAGINPDTYLHDIGVFAGAGRHAYLRYAESQFGEEDFLDGSIYGLQSDIGNYGDFLATRVSYRLGLRGPSLNVQTACSTSLVAVHLACQSLVLGETDVALAGGVNLHTPQFNGYWYEEGSICSPDGHLRPFDALANGSVFGNGGGVVVLKRLLDVIDSGDRVIAVIKSTAINNDAADKMSFTAPSVSGQAEVIRRAHRIAGVELRSIGYIETHGTGTVLGDPIEVAALVSAFGMPKEAAPYCALGTVKSQIGHLGPAAGIAGLIKAALVVERGHIPPCVNFQTPNPAIPFDGSPFFVPTKGYPWLGFRRAGVSAFGVGGTNAHAILEQAPEFDRGRTPSARPLPIIVSALSARALQEARLNLADHLVDTDNIRLGDVSHVLATGRRTMKHRVALTASTVVEAAERLADPIGWPSTSDPRVDAPVVFGFPGMGAQYVGAGRALYDNDAEFRAAFDACCSLSAANALDMYQVLLPEDGFVDEAMAKLRLPRWGQPGIFIVEYALAKSLLAAGIEPDVMIGHSVGEYAAACLAGVFTLPEALRLVIARGRLMNETTPGAMMAIGLAAAEVERILPPDLDIAAINAREQTVVAGPIDAIAAFEDHFASTTVLHTVLGTSVAAHSSLMDPIMASFSEVLETVYPKPPKLRIASTLLGGMEGIEFMTDRNYWVRHLREPVRFMDAAKAIAARGPMVVVEVGPGRALAGMMRQSQGDLATGAVTPWLPKEPESQSSAAIVAAVWAVGGRVNWTKQFEDQAPKRIALPGYPFERSSFWIENGANCESKPAVPLSMQQRAEIFLQTPFWRMTPFPVRTDQNLRRHILALVKEPGSTAARMLAEAGHIVHEFVVSPIVGATQAVDALTQLESGHGMIDTILVLDQSVPAKDLQTGVADVLESMFWPTLAFVSAAAHRRGTSPLDCFLITTDRHLVPGDRAQRPELALINGPARVLPQEYPNVRVAEIDFSSSMGTARPAELVRAEVDNIQSGSVIAYRGSNRYTLQYRSARQTVGMPPWVTGCNYLITGGVGAIGLAIAEDAARIPGVSLTLTHRTPLPDISDVPRLLASSSTSPDLRHQLESLERIRATGTAIRCVVADVCDAAAMRKVYTTFGPFTGIVHAAGLPGGRLIEQLSLTDTQRVMAPKVQGALVLHEVVADDSTDWMVLCSSLSGAIGGVGHVDYSSANAFLDAFSAWRTKTGRRTLSLAYDEWADVGMAAKEAAKSAAARTMAGRSSRARLQSIDHSLFCSEWFDDHLAEYHGWLRQGVNWMVDEHHFRGVGLLPGTAIIEYLRGAAARRLRSDHIRLTEVDLLRPIVVNSEFALQIAVVIEHHEEDVTATLICRAPGAADWVEHAVARVGGYPLSRSERGGRIAPISIDIAIEQAPKSRSNAISLGPRWDNVTGMCRLNPRELVVECELPPKFRSEVEKYGVHPALLDTAAGSLLPLVDESAYLPISYESIDMWQPMPAKVRSHIVQRSSHLTGSLTFDIRVQDFDGAEVLEIVGYTLRKVDVDELARMFIHPPTTEAEPGNMCLISAEPGDLTALKFVQEERYPPSTNEVEIRVLATGLNFKEVLIASNLLPDIDMGFRFGLECAGVVTRVGTGVKRFHPGDSVMAIGSSCFSTFTCIGESLVQPIPIGLTYAQAATVPVAFTTAYDSLVNCAHLQPGERVLVHSVTGGVGMAAVQIATHLGAQVFGTAGTEQKRDVARKLGVELVMDSRSTAFEHRTIEAGGVDVVLNSLSGDSIDAGLRALRPRGRFVELGRRDILSARPLDMSVFATGRTLTSYYPEPDSLAFSASFRRVAELLESKDIEPLPLHCFPIADVTEAFAFMSQARHIGKVVAVRLDGEGVAHSRADGSTFGSKGITAVEGVRAMRIALALDLPHVLVTKRSVGAVGSSADPPVAEHVLQTSKNVPVRAREELDYEFVPLEGDIETRLGNIWASTLSIERVGRNDQFLDLGGDSLYATQVAARVRKEFGVRIAPSAILGKFSLYELAAEVDEHMTKQGVH